MPPKPASAPVEQVGLRVSLIPSEESERRDPRRGFRRFVIAVAVMAVLVGSLIGYLGLRVRAGKIEAESIARQADELDRQASTLSDSLKEARLAQSRLRALSGLLSSHRNVSPVFSFLERNTLSDVAYSNASIAENGTVNLSASAASLEAYAGQIAQLRTQPEVKSLSFSGLNTTFDENDRIKQVDFTMSIEFGPEFYISGKEKE